MKISEVAKMSGLPKDTIRYYTKMGLIKAGEKEAGTRIYANYGKDELKKIEMILQGKQLGFTLQEIKHLLDLYESGNMSKDQQVAITKEKLVFVEDKMKALKKMKQLLINKLKELA